MDTNIEIHHGDCAELLKDIPASIADLVYLDPPFFTQRMQTLGPRDRSKIFTFDDRWSSISDYATYLNERLKECHRILKESGSIFFHCDKTASHIVRYSLDDVFGPSNFQSEIIWSYKRWSNSARKLLPAHQTILFYSKSKKYKFNKILTDYSPTTNIDQILQRRSRDSANKSVYARKENGDIIYQGAKEGVPLSDVWEIPFLNPKAKERIGYPTQKPILLLDRIIKLVTDPGDLVVDPFCGSGTTLVAAMFLNRSAIGIDISREAIELTRIRLSDPVKTESRLLKNGVESYINVDDTAISLLNGIPHVPVHRNKGIDAFLKVTINGVPIPVRVQKQGESVSEAANALEMAARSKNASQMILIVTDEVPTLFPVDNIPDSMIVIHSVGLSIKKVLAKIESDNKEQQTKYIL